ncbi:TPA: hypothetical protein N0F65_007576, partial [Lagenidium giganteum]
ATDVVARGLDIRSVVRHPLLVAIDDLEVRAPYRPYGPCWHEGHRSHVLHGQRQATCR